MNNIELAEFLKENKDKIKEKAKEALELTIKAKENNEKSYFIVVILEDGSCFISKNHENISYEAKFFEFLSFNSQSLNLDFFKKNFDYLFNNIWFNMFILYLKESD